MVKTISSPDNLKIKALKRLMTKSSFRKMKKQFVLEGKRIVLDADLSKIEIIFVSDKFLENNDIENLDANIICIKDELFNKISETKNSQGILAIANISTVSDEVIEKADLILYLDAISDPGNMGTIIRTAEASGVDLIILSKDCVDIYNPKVVRSSMGSILRQNIIYDEDKTFLQKLKNKNYEILLTDICGTKTYFEYEYKQKTVLVMGSEANGVSECVKVYKDEAISIPMKGNIESLNVAIATAIILFHISSMRK